MGLHKDVETHTGYPGSYIRVKSVEVVYEVFVDQTARSEGKRPVEVNKVVWENKPTTTTPDNEAQPTNEAQVTEGYLLLKMLELFEDAEDC